MEYNAEERNVSPDSPCIIIPAKSPATSTIRSRGVRVSPVI